MGKKKVDQGQKMRKIQETKKKKFIGVKNTMSNGGNIIAKIEARTKI